jgi:hypothetical protein
MILTGNYIQPIAYSCLPAPANGSVYCGCPASCIDKSGSWACRQCSGTGQRGYIIDGEIPSIDVGSNTWASRLFTWRSDGVSTLTLGFEFQNSIILHEVELYLFHCPTWNIGFPEITVIRGRDFPRNIALVGGDLGTISLTDDMQDCMNIIRICISLMIYRNSSTFSLRFRTSTPSSQQWIHIAKVRFSDDHELIPTTASAPTLTNTQHG